mmetsp:Transcript_68594/g.123620  ORF Transcript_68594/g.123620 Transcript_68594/m.123620 type:complete len:104 (+) Transcript_68594:1493-1804(+)
MNSGKLRSIRNSIYRDLDSSITTRRECRDGKTDTCRMAMPLQSLRRTWQIHQGWDSGWLGGRHLLKPQLQKHADKDHHNLGIMGMARRRPDGTTEGTSMLMIW